MKNTYLDSIRRIDQITATFKSPAEEFIRTNKKMWSSLEPLIERHNLLMEKMHPSEAFIKAMESNISGFSSISDSLSKVVEEWNFVSDILQNSDYSNLIVPDSLSTKLNDLIHSVQEELPALEDEILQSSEIVIDESSSKPKLDLNQMIAIITIILMVLGMVQNQYNADQSSIQTERHHQERMEQMERHHQEMSSLISELYSYLTSENKTNSKDQ